jgi:hypothetical protein
MFTDLRPMHDSVRDAIAVLSNMRVTTQPMTEPEMGDIEQRRITALGYLQTADESLKALRKDAYVADVREAAMSPLERATAGLDRTMACAEGPEQHKNCKGVVLWNGQPVGPCACECHAVKE